MMEVRAEQLQDLEAIRKVNVAAFGRQSEADLVDRLRGYASTFSLVALESDQIVGHIFFSPVVIEGECDGRLLILGLAPLAVLPEHQRKGVGSLLIQSALKVCDRLKCKAVVVLGDPKYYSKFGFVPAHTKGLRCEYTVRDESFMVLELEGGALEGCVGIVKYCSEFNQLESL